MTGREAIQVAKTVMEVADVAWKAVECCHQHHHHEETETKAVSREELEALKSENDRLRNLLEQNLKLLENLSESPALLNDCPPDLYARLVATVDSGEFLSRLRKFRQESINGTGIEFPFKEATGDDMLSAGLLINVDQENPSWWVWVTDEMVPSNVEEWSGIDDESYVIVSEEHVVDGVANFMAKCIFANPKAQNVTPEELQKILAKALGGGGKLSKLEKIFGIWHAGKMLFALSTWGLALAGLYSSRPVLKLAAMGVHTTSKVVMKAL
ncbi:uncharacterized protein LOC123206095 [Mangifera indica]|uniref:uncharacterized protein LOC123206095 n=1 Tax=Mangifera indica TaxID=29780 RepID=UPI001CFA5299|nr:uncharacterized protein LOC123206095 [Mangifera indica]